MQSYIQPINLTPITLTAVRMTAKCLIRHQSLSPLEYCELQARLDAAKTDYLTDERQQVFTITGDASRYYLSKLAAGCYTR